MTTKWLSMCGAGVGPMLKGSIRVSSQFRTIVGYVHPPIGGRFPQMGRFPQIGPNLLLHPISQKVLE